MSTTIAIEIPREIVHITRMTGKRSCSKVTKIYEVAMLSALSRASTSASFALILGKHTLAQRENFFGRSDSNSR